MNIIFSMTLSGSILFLLFIIVDPLCRNLFSQHLRYLLLKIALLFHLIPLRFFLSFLKDNCDLVRTARRGSNIFINGDKSVIVIASDEYQYNTAFQTNCFIFTIWLFISILVFLYYIWKFRKWRKHIIQISQEVTSPYILNILNHYQTKLHMKPNTRLYQINENISPFTIGILRPIIVIPQMKNSFALDAAICHELHHIKRKDEFMLFLRLFITAIYWFNPLIYFLNLSLSKSCEFTCDESVIKDLSITNRKKYAELIIDLAANTDTFFQKPIIALNPNNKFLKERIQFIMNGTKQTSYAAILLSTVLLLCSMIPVFAYEPIQKFKYQSDEPAAIHYSSTDFITYSDTCAFEESNDIEIEITISCENQFTDTDGTIVPVKNPFYYENCDHSFLDGTFTNHSKNSEGNCTVTYQAAQRCSKCDHIKIGFFIKKMEYSICPH